MKQYIRLIRVKHWIKNILILIPMLCAGLFSYENCIQVLFSFFSFSCMSSFIYILNDIRDIEKDRLHPRKKKRPLASGAIKKNKAIVIATIALILSLLFNYFGVKSLIDSSFVFLLSYLFINVAYSMGLKNQAVVDVCLLASGFVLRVYYGASILSIPVSSWLFLTILSVSLFLGLGKRKKELQNNKDTRKVLNVYTESFLNNFMYLCLTLTLVFYSLWTLEQGEYLIFTVPLLIIIFMKYCLIIEKEIDGDPTTILYKDKVLFLICALYGVVMLILMLGA